MESFVLAKIFGIFLTIVGLGVVIKRDHFHDVIEDIIYHPGIQLVAAIVPILVGSTIVVLHPSTAHNWTILITILGYLLIAAGTFRLFFSHVWVNILCRIKNSNLPIIPGIILLTYGLTLLCHGFELHHYIG